MAETTEFNDLKEIYLSPMSLTSAECFLKTRQQRYSKDWAAVTGQWQYKLAHAIDQHAKSEVAGQRDNINR